MKVSKVVLIVVALHVLVIGGIFIFEGCSRAKAPAEMTSAEPGAADESAANQAALPPDTTATSNLTPAQPTTAPVAPAPAPAVAARSYSVKKGDTLWKVAKAEHISIGELARANNLTKASTLRVGQKLTVPAKAEATTAAVAAVQPVASATDTMAPATPAAAGTVYTVKSGDSLWKIAKAQNVSVTSLKQANNLTSDSLKVNQKLTIPVATAAATPTASTAVSSVSNTEFQPGTHNENGQTFHIVNIGETPAIIAKQYGVKVDELMKANNVNDTKRIMVGQKLVIPVATPSASAGTTATPAVAAPIATASN